MNYSYLPLAKAELIEAIKYYEEIKTGLGEDFYGEILLTINRIIEFPNAWSPLKKEYRAMPLFLH